MEEIKGIYQRKIIWILRLEFDGENKILEKAGMM